MYRLRDYVLHCAFPVTDFAVAATNGVDDHDGVQVRFLVDREKLLSAHFDWRKIERRDLKALDDKFEIDSMAEEYMECLRRVYWDIIDDRVRAAAEVHPVIEEAFHRVPNVEAGHRPFLAAVEAGEDEQGPIYHIGRRTIPFELSQRIVETIEGERRPSDLVKELSRSEEDHPQIDDQRLKAELGLGVAVMSAFIEHDFGPDLARKVNAMLDERGIVPVFQGVASVSHLALGMAAKMYGRSVRDVLGRIAELAE